MWRPITVKRATKTPDGAGGNTVVYSELLNTRAEIVTKKGSIRLESGQYKQTILTIATIYKRAGYTPEQSDLIVWKGKEYSIGPMRDINAPQYDKTELTLFALYGQD